MTRQLLVVALAAMLVLAGCSAPVSPGSDNGGGAQGTMQFYVSDENNAIDDFEHLNVTITKVGLHKADADETETEDETEEETAENETAENESTETEADDESGWVERDVNDRTVDLTELKGANATMLAEFNVSNGTYDKAFIYISEVNGTLTNGEQVDVKLPSSKMKLNKEFTVGNGEEVQFVYDITVVKRGKSGSYNIKPVVGESGTDVPIKDVDADDESDDESDDASDDETPETPETPETESEDASANGQASMNFYVSDEKNAIGDFAHLNVSISKIGVHGEDGWTEHQVEDGTVDLTKLQGDNATLLSQFNVSEGSYDKVFIYVSEVNGTLTNGEAASVKLPSSKFRLNKGFNASAGEDVDFVYDITVVKRGNSGSYNLKPVIGESGTDVPIDEVDRDGKPADDDESEESALTASFVGNVTAGANATVSVSYNGSAVENATVTYAGATYQTDADGTATFAVPENATEVEVTVTYEDAEVELTETLEGSSEADTSGDSSGSTESGSSGTESGSDDSSGTSSSGTETATPTPA